jgi:hypothetical protein
LGQLSRFFRVAPFDATVFLITLVFIGVLGFFGVTVLLAVMDNKDPAFFDVGAGFLLAIVLAYSLLRSVRGYRLKGSELVIERLGPGRLRIPVADIASAEIGEDLGNFVRSGYLSVQGLFGWAGKVHVRKPTDVKSQLVEVYGTNPSNAVVLNLRSERRVILTPRDVEGFLGALKESGVGNKPQPVRKSYLPPARKKKGRK